MAEPCSQPCDHCRPDEWHGCVRPKGDGGYHSCQRDPEDDDA